MEAIADAAAGFAFPLVVDPVMLSKNGAALLDDSARVPLPQLAAPRVSAHAQSG